MPEHDDDNDARPSLRKRLSRRILGDEDGKSLLSEAREAASEAAEAVRGRPEIVRMIAREVRSYLDELGLKEDLRNLMTNYSVEVKASFHLRKLAEHEKGQPEPRAKDAAPG